MTGILNMEVIDELLALSDDGDPELLVDLIQMFLADSPSKQDAIMRGVASNDWGQVERAAHALKGSAGNLGAVLVQADCDRIQIACRKNETTELPKQAKTLVQNLKNAETALRELLGRIKP